VTRPVDEVARVGVVIVHFGDIRPTLACVEAVRRDSSSCSRRIVVVDNGVSLGSDSVPGAEIVSLRATEGFGAGANAGVAALGGGPWDALVILNNDVEVVDGYLDGAVAALSRPAVALAGGPLYLDRPGGVLWYAGGGINWLTGTVRQSRSRRAAMKRRSTGFVPGAAFAVRPDAWRQVGGFDPGYFLYNEDVDLCLRLRRRKWRLLYESTMVAVHRLGAVTGSASRSPFYLEHMAATRLRPFRPFVYRVYLAFLHTNYVVLRACAYRLVVRGEGGRESSRALLRGHRRALSTLRVVSGRGDVGPGGVTDSQGAGRQTAG
jgi:N-acetylglucosaminyl-diphospho-decaprenol L-rhamnosyltransferase